MKSFAFLAALFLLAALPTVAPAAGWTPLPGYVPPDSVDVDAPPFPYRRASTPALIGWIGTLHDADQWDWTNQWYIAMEFISRLAARLGDDPQAIAVEVEHTREQQGWHNWQRPDAQERALWGFAVAYWWYDVRHWWK